MELEQGEECERKGLMNLHQQAPHQKTWNCHPMIETKQCCSSTFADTNINVTFCCSSPVARLMFRNVCSRQCVYSCIGSSYLIQWTHVGVVVVKWQPNDVD